MEEGVNEIVPILHPNFAPSIVIHKHPSSAVVEIIGFFDDEWRQITMNVALNRLKICCSPVNVSVRSRQGPPFFQRLSILIYDIGSFLLFLFVPILYLKLRLNRKVSPQPMP